MNATAFEAHHLDGPQPLVTLRWLDPLFDRSYGFTPKFLHVLFTASESEKDQQTRVLRHTNPQFANSSSRDARPGFHEPAKPGGDVGGRLLLPTRRRSGKTKNAIAYDAAESAEIENFPVMSQTLQVRRQIRIVRPSDGDSWEKLAFFETKSRRPLNPQASPSKARANGHGMGSGAIA
jgi:hypothetical protein